MSQKFFAFNCGALQLHSFSFFSDFVTVEAFYNIICFFFPFFLNLQWRSNRSAIAGVPPHNSSQCDRDEGNIRPTKLAISAPRATNLIQKLNSSSLPEIIDSKIEGFFLCDESTHDCSLHCQFFMDIYRRK
mgnify:CR=1 FL=1